jgi:hypothetical protein
MSRTKLLRIRSWETEESVENNTGKMAKNEKSKRRRHGTCVSQRTTTAMGLRPRSGRRSSAKLSHIVSGISRGINSATCSPVLSTESSRPVGLVWNLESEG